jgi:hypothetical protein
MGYLPPPPPPPDPRYNPSSIRGLSTRNMPPHPKKTSDAKSAPPYGHDDYDGWLLLLVILLMVALAVGAYLYDHEVGWIVIGAWLTFAGSFELSIITMLILHSRYSDHQEPFDELDTEVPLPPIPADKPGYTEMWR